MFRENNGDINKKFERKVVMMKTVKLAFVLSDLKVGELNGNKCRTGAQKKHQS